MKTVTISRKRWGRGNTGGSLRRKNTGRMCCLGFACLAFELTPRDIRGFGYPSDVAEDVREKLPQWLRRESDDVERLAVVNDSVEVEDSVRERKIRAIFKRHGLRAVFTA